MKASWIGSRYFKNVIFYWSIDFNYNISPSVGVSFHTGRFICYLSRWSKWSSVPNWRRYEIYYAGVRCALNWCFICIYESSTTPPLYFMTFNGMPGKTSLVDLYGYNQGDVRALVLRLEYWPYTSSFVRCWCRTIDCLSGALPPRLAKSIIVMKLLITVEGKWSSKSTFSSVVLPD